MDIILKKYRLKLEPLGLKHLKSTHVVIRNLICLWRKIWIELN